MARYRRETRRRERQNTLWIPYLYSVSVTLPNDTTTIKSGVLGTINLEEFIDADCTLERIRGRMVIVKATTGVGQFIVAGRIVSKELADATANATPDLIDVKEVGDDFPLWLPFACVDSDATSRWNGHEIDMKSKRRIGESDRLQLCYTAKSVDTSGINENYFVGMNMRALIRFA